MSYFYADHKSNLFTEEGQRMFLKMRDEAFRLCDLAGCVCVVGDSWAVLACADRMVEIGDLIEVPQERIVGQHSHLPQASPMSGLIGAKSCRSCEHRRIGGPNILCARFPPQVLMIPVPGPNGTAQPGIQSFYPTVNPDIPCGEYRRNETFAAEEIGAAQAGAGLRQ